MLDGTVTQLALAGVAPPVLAGDALHRFYTPDRLASAVVDRLAPAALSWVLEPSCGGGAFVRALQRRGCLVVGCDLDPEAVGLQRVDLAWPGSLESFPGSYDPLGWAVGNPPFGGPSDDDDEQPYVGAHHALICLQHAPRVGLILPAAWALFEGHGRVPSPMQTWRAAGARPVRVSAIAGRAWGDHLREAALFEWERGVDGPTTVGEPITWRRS